MFHEPLGQAREVKVALSGLFGRFVARAYLERYFGLSVFAHLGPEPLVLDGRLQIHVVRREKGDLPDWIACAASLSNLTVAEAKGCHDSSGPNRALGRAWRQASRVDVVAHGLRATTKRLAIVTRWGMATGGPSEPRIAVRDPVDEGDPIEGEHKDAIFVGLYRHHLANMISSLGHVELAESLRKVASSHTIGGRRSAAQRAQRLVDQVHLEDFRIAVDRVEAGELIGGFITRAGPLATRVSPTERQALARLDLRPVFVGIERASVRVAIEGESLSIRKALADRSAVPATVRSDGAGSWIIPLNDDAFDDL